MRSLRVVLMIGVAAAALPFAPAFAEWSPRWRGSFYDKCWEACRGGNVTKNVQCGNYCACLMREMETSYPDEREFRRLDGTMNPEPAYAQRARAIHQSCNR